MRLEDMKIRGVTVVRLTGAFDRMSLKDLMPRLQELMDDSGMRVVLNLQAVPFIDSSGMSFLLRARRRADTESGGLVIVCANQLVQRTFATLGIDRMFEFVADEEAAIDVVADENA